MVRDNLIMENVRIGFRNFAGVEGKFNPPGRRNFCVFIDDPVLAKDLESDGWNIKYLQPRDPQDDQQAYMQVRVSFDNIPPKIVMITSRNKTMLDADDVKILDWAEIANVDLIIRPYNWDVNGRTGVTAYLKNMYVTIVEDEFEDKYRDVPDSAQNSVGSDGY